jgi:hypothetical protein
LLWLDAMGCELPMPRTLELAVRTSLPLASRDVALAQTAEATGVMLFKS